MDDSSTMAVAPMEEAPSGEEMDTQQQQQQQQQQHEQQPQPAHHDEPLEQQEQEASAAQAPAAAPMEEDAPTGNGESSGTTTTTNNKNNNNNNNNNGTSPPAAAAAVPAPSVAPATSMGGARPGQLNFRKLEPRTLVKYLEHHGLSAKPDANADELAALVARHFESEHIEEDVVLHSFFMSGMQATNTLGKFDKKRKRGTGPSGNGGPPHASIHFGGGSGYTPGPRGKDAPVRGGGAGGGSGGAPPPAVAGSGGGGGGGAGSGSVAKVDEEVAARLSTQVAEDVTAGWILARVVKYVPERDSYQVRDEDDHANVQTLSSSVVIRLHEENLLNVQKNDTVLAVFPDTTSFYRAQVTKVPKRAQNGLGQLEVMVKFEDDEDETGRTPHRRVPARHVLKLSQVGRLEGGGDNYSDGGSKKGASLKDYKVMISHALQKLPNSKGTLKEIFKIIENDFRDDLSWKMEGEGKKTPVWKNQVRKLLVNPRSGFMFINSGERGSYYGVGEGEGGGGGGGSGGGSGSFQSS